MTLKESLFPHLTDTDALNQMLKRIYHNKKDGFPSFVEMPQKMTYRLDPENERARD